MKISGWSLVLVLFIALGGQVSVTKGIDLTNTESELDAGALPVNLDFQLQDLMGQNVRLSDYAGKVIVLNFWASWCFPCLYEMPLLQKVHDRFKDRGLVVIAIAVYDQLEPARAFSDKYGFTFPMLFDTDGVSKRIFNVTGVPETYIIDRLGHLVPFKDPATGVSSTLINNPMVWEGEEILELLSDVVER